MTYVHMVGHIGTQTSEWRPNIGRPMDLPTFIIQLIKYKAWHVTCGPTFQNHEVLGKDHNMFCKKCFIPCKRWGMTKMPLYVHNGFGIFLLRNPVRN